MGDFRANPEHTPLAKVLAALPQFADAHIHLAQTLALQGNKDEAVQHYNEALRILKSGPTTTKGPLSSSRRKNF
jgi:hypothetical protein